MRAKALFFGLLLLTLFLTFGCQSVTHTPSLLTLTGMSPSELELGDELEISGNGFPEGKSARVAFRGDLYRAGSPVERDVEIVARTTSGSPRSLSLALTETLRQAFTGTDDDAKHTTFRGDIEVSFTPKQAGSAPVLGVLSDVVLDVEPPLVSPTLQQQRDRSADEALAFLGIELRSSDVGQCCVVAGATGRAAMLGLRASDRIVDLDGVTVKSRWDLVPSSHKRTSRLSFRHAGSGPIVVRELDVQGYRSAAPSELSLAMGLVGFALAMLLLYSTRLGRPLGWAVRWLSQRLRERPAEPSPTRLNQPKSRFCIRFEWFGLPEDPAYHLLSVILLVALTAMATGVGFRVELISRELDLLLWCLSQTVSVVWASVLVTVAERTRLFRSGVRAAAASLVHQLPLLALVLVCVVEAKSFSLFDLMDAQEPTVLGWNVFRNPAGFLLTALAILALVPVIKPGPERIDASDDGTFRGPGRLAQLSLGLGRVLGGTLHLWSSALLISLLALGGYRVPGVSSAAYGTSLGFQLMGVLLLFSKTVFVVLAVVSLRYVGGEVRTKDCLLLWFRHGLLLVIGAVGLAWVWAWAGHRFALRWFEDVTAWVLLAATLMAVAFVSAKAIQKARLSRSEVGPNPWI